LKSAQAKLAEAGKKFKQMGYVTEEALTGIAVGKLKPVDGLRALLFDRGALCAKAGVLCMETEAKRLPEKMLETEAMQHNQVDRMAGATVEGMLYYRLETFFTPGTGLWALLRCDPADFDRLIHPALRYLADTGFGADRTTGKGQFDIEVQPFASLPQATVPQSMMTLSHYLPIAAEIDYQSQPIAYTLMTLRPKREQKFQRSMPAGQKTPPVYKQAVRVFEPGSIFSLKAIKAKKEIYGQLVRLTPPEQEAIFQSGAAIMLYL
jgi:CRISPR type III-A-associated RAMP protein Csm4